MDSVPDIYKAISISTPHGVSKANIVVILAVNANAIRLLLLPASKWAIRWSLSTYDGNFLTPVSLISRTLSIPTLLYSLGFCLCPSGASLGTSSSNWKMAKVIIIFVCTKHDGARVAGRGHAPPPNPKQHNNTFYIVINSLFLLIRYNKNIVVYIY